MPQLRSMKLAACCLSGRADGVMLSLGTGMSVCVCVCVCVVVVGGGGGEQSLHLNFAGCPAKQLPSVM